MDLNSNDAPVALHGETDMVVQIVSQVVRKLTTPQYFYHYSMHIMVLAFVLLTVSRVAYVGCICAQLPMLSLAVIWLVDGILIIITWQNGQLLGYDRQKKSFVKACCHCFSCILSF